MKVLRLGWLGTHTSEHSGMPRRLVRWVLSRLLGWRYDGSPEARLRAVTQMPMVALRPARG